MKFLKSEPFEKHLKEALPAHPSSFYALIIKDYFEKTFLKERLIKQLGAHKVERVDLFGLNQALDSLDLFYEKKIIVVEEIETLSSERLSAILPKMRTISPEITLIFLGNSLKSIPKLYENLKKEAVFLDLSAEKPWDRLSRLRRWMLEYVQSHGKTLDPDAKEYLFEQGFNDFSSLLKELNKVFTYIGDNTSVHLSDLQSVCHFEVALNSWSLSEAFIWGGALSADTMSALTQNALFALIPQLRYHLTLGLKIAGWLFQGKESEIQKNYPKLRPATLSKYVARAKELGQSYFTEGLNALFALEIGSRSGKSLPALISSLALRLQIKRELSLK